MKQDPVRHHQSPSAYLELEVYPPVLASYCQDLLCDILPPPAWLPGQGQPQGGLGAAGQGYQGCHLDKQEKQEVKIGGFETYQWDIE